MSQLTDPQVMMEVYFVPFAIETYTPNAMNEISDKAHQIIWFTKQHPLITKLSEILTGVPSTTMIDNRVIRLKLSIQGREFFVDKEGVVFEPAASKNYILTQEQLEDIETDILYFSGVVDIQASRAVRKVPEKGVRNLFLPIERSKR